ncbi:MAG: polymer-forming cytoskeletal protein [Burkholderiaceae bacterium]
MSTAKRLPFSLRRCMLRGVARRGLSGLILALGAMLAIPTGAHADEPERVASASAGADRFFAGSTVRVSDPVPGDLIVTGGTIDVSADVAGDALVFGGRVRIDRSVAGSVYAAGGQFTLAGRVGGNARVLGGQHQIERGSRIDGNLSIGGAQVRIEGDVGGYVQAGGGTLYIDGIVGGDVLAGGGSIELGPRAHVKGRLRYGSGDAIQRDPAARVDGGIEKLAGAQAMAAAHRDAEQGSRAGAVVWTLGLMVLAAILVAWLPARWRRIGDALRATPGAAALTGFITLVCVPVAIVIALVTVIGVPLALLAILAYLALLMVGYLTAGIALGEWGLRRFASAREARTGWRALAAGIGVLVVGLLAAIPFLGAFIALAALLLGVGALVRHVRGTDAGAVS